MQRKFLGIIAVDFDGTGQLLIGHSAYVKYWRKKWEYNEAVHKLFIDYKKVDDSLRREVLYNIIIEFGISMQLVKLMNETCSRVRVGKYV
jgi:hypothetical protein